MVIAGCTGVLTSKPLLAFNIGLGTA